MGSDDAEDDERPAPPGPPRRLSSSAVQPVTHAEYARFVRETGHRVAGHLRAAAGRDRRRPRARAARSARSVSPTCGWIGHRRRIAPITRSRSCATTTRSRTAPGSRARPAARRFGCRPKRNGRRPRAAASKSKRYPWGDRLDRNMANFLMDPSLKTTHGTTPCRSYPPNGYGLFDMAGNVWEWVLRLVRSALVRTARSPQQSRPARR